MRMSLDCNGPLSKKGSDWSTSYPMAVLLCLSLNGTIGGSANTA